MTIPATLDRRSFLAAGATTAFVGLSSQASAADLTEAERANVKIVNDFCATWPSHDIDKLVSFFAEDGAYRVTETAQPAKGHEAVTARIKGFLDQVQRFEVLDTFARGPMVINERIDRFSGGRLKSWHGVGVFFLKDGKIVEWYDYTIAAERT
jgi:limonene-1,2-epoxide hydrolase